MDSNQEAQIFYYLKEAFEKSNNFKLSYSATLSQFLLSFVHYLNSILRNFFPLIVWTELCMCLFLAPWSHFNHLTKNACLMLTRRILTWHKKAWRRNDTLCGKWPEMTKRKYYFNRLPMHWTKHSPMLVATSFCILEYWS